MNNKTISSAIITVALAMTGCSNQGDNGRADFEASMEKYDITCPACQIAIRDIVEHKQSVCGGDFNELLVETAEKNPVTFSLTALNRLNPNGYQAYRYGAFATMNCSDVDKWNDDFSNFLMSEEWKTFYNEHVPQTNLPTYAEQG